jgi:hypothetical protein
MILKSVHSCQNVLNVITVINVNTVMILNNGISTRNQKIYQQIVLYLKIMVIVLSVYRVDFLVNTSSLKMINLKILKVKIQQQ